MKQLRIAAQLYSFRDFIKTPAGVLDTLRKLRAAGYRAVQLSSSLAPMPEEELKRLLEGEGIAAPTSHEKAADLISEPRKVIDRLLALGCRHVAYPFPHWMPTGEGETVALAAELNRAAKTFREAGITFAYHNHAAEFRKFNNRTMLELLYEHAPLLDGEPDTYWVQKGGGDPAAWIERLNGRLQVLHVKDFGVVPEKESAMLPVGSGNLDWKRIFAAAERSGVEWYVVEHDGDCADPFASFAASMNYLRENFVS